MSAEKIENELTDKERLTGKISQDERDANFYLAVCKQGIHSFIIVGVKEKDGTDRTLMRIGKSNSIDPDFDRQLKMALKAVGSSTLSYIQDEGITRRNAGNTSLNYQAHDINFEQLCDVYRLVAQIAKEQKEDPVIREGVKQMIGRTEEKEVDAALSIECYLPRVNKNGRLSFRYKEDISQYESYENKWPKSHLDKKATVDPIIAGGKSISIANTCRTTALNILEGIIGVGHNISKLFIISPRYETTLVHGQLTNVYSLPPHPATYTDLSDKQQSRLKKIYERLQEIPSKNPNDKATKEKFHALKQVYKDMAGPNRANIADYLTRVMNDEAKKEALFTKRDPSLISRILHRKSSTEQLFKAMKKEAGKLQENSREEPSPKTSRPPG